MRWLPLATLVVALARSSGACPGEEPRRCAGCEAQLVEKLKVVVTDFASGREHEYCNVACAMRGMMENFPTARVIAHDPFAGKEVRIIRTGVKWVAWPKSAVFLYLPQPHPDEEDGQEASSCPTTTTSPQAQDLDPPRRCLAFPRQVEYIQYLATHADVAAHKPRPLRLPELLAALRPQDQQQDEDRTTAD